MDLAEHGDNPYPRELDEKGCIYGRAVSARVGDLGDDVDKLEKKIDRMTNALMAAALTFGTAAVMLGLNLVLR